MGFFHFSSKNNKNLILLIIKKWDFLKNQKKQVNCFLENTRFLSTLIMKGV